jgi:hypothetical protein
MSLRLTKQQRTYQEHVLADCGLTEEFKPSATLVTMLAVTLVSERQAMARLTFQYAQERDKPLWKYIADRWRMWREGEKACAETKTPETTI